MKKIREIEKELQEELNHSNKDFIIWFGVSIIAIIFAIFVPKFWWISAIIVFGVWRYSSQKISAIKLKKIQARSKANEELQIYIKQLIQKDPAIYNNHLYQKMDEVNNWLNQRISDTRWFDHMGNLRSVHEWRPYSKMDPMCKWIDMIQIEFGTEVKITINAGDMATGDKKAW